MEARTRMAEVQTLDITLSALPTAKGRISTQFPNGANAPAARVFVKLTAGTAPAEGGSVRYYIVRTDKASADTHIDGGLGVVDAQIDTEPATGLVHTIPLSTTGSEEYKQSFLIDEPGPDFSIVTWNGASTDLDASEANQYVRLSFLHGER